MNLTRIITFLSFALLAVLALFILRDNRQVWKQYQYEFNKLLIAKSAGKFSLDSGIKEIRVEQLNVVDRCTTCHLGVEIPSLKDARQPFAYHPVLAPHEFEKLGCTVCHRGQGRATTVAGAHGESRSWNKPLLSGEYIQASCGTCHASQVKGAPLLAKGAELFRQSACLGCHLVGRQGSKLGTDLTGIGEKYSVAYLLESIEKPDANTLQTTMPRLPFTALEKKALVIYLLSLTGKSPPIQYIAYDKLTAMAKPKKRPISAPAPPGSPHFTVPEEKLFVREEMRKRGRKLFTSLGCNICHNENNNAQSVAPKLSGMVSKDGMKRVFVFLKSPRAADSFNVMPVYNLSDQDYTALTAYILGERQGFSKKL